ncbi:MAG: hypothetical protein SGPRY_009191 [Prymnesium sp.]
MWYALAAAFMWLSMWIDRYNLLRQFAPPPRSPDALIDVVLRIILPVAMIVHLLCEPPPRPKFDPSGWTAEWLTSCRMDSM